MAEGFKRASCGKVHQGLPRSFAADFPDIYANMKREERDARTIIGTDQCIVDRQWFFIRGCLEIPVLGSTDPFLWGLWASVVERVYDEISESWEENGRERIREPFKGRLANSLSIYAETLNLRVTIVIQQVWSALAGLPNLHSLQPVIGVFHTFPTAIPPLLYSPQRPRASQ
jgi:hypothetical protein